MREIKKIKKKQIHTFYQDCFLSELSSYFMEMSSGCSLCKWHHSTRLKKCLVHMPFYFWVTFTEMSSCPRSLSITFWSHCNFHWCDLCPSYYCWITHHPKLNGVNDKHFIMLTIPWIKNLERAQQKWLIFALWCLRSVRKTE